MLIHSNKIINTPVLSLHVGGKIAETVSPVIDPATLQIIAFTLAGPTIGKVLDDGEVGDLLDVKYIREFSNLGFIVNSHDDFTTREDAIRIKKILDLNFTLPGKRVVTKRGTKLGRVADYTLDPATFQVHQLIVKRPALKSLVDPELVISRSQITKITDHEITVKDEEQKVKKESIKEEFTPNFVNPFRERSFAPVQNQTPDELDTK